jgi:hypothetical protein
MTRRTVTSRFGRAFHQAAERATRLHFALDTIDDIEQAVWDGRRGFISGNFTNAELRHIMTTPHLLQKTLFSRGGKLVPSPTFARVRGGSGP